MAGSSNQEPVKLLLSSVDKSATSRAFSARTMKSALRALPSSQAKDVRESARTLSNKVGIGYYAALDVVALIGIFLVETPSSRTGVGSSGTSS